MVYCCVFVHGDKRVASVIPIQCRSTREVFDQLCTYRQRMIFPKSVCGICGNYFNHPIKLILPAIHLKKGNTMYKIYWVKFSGLCFSGSKFWPLKFVTSRWNDSPSWQHTCVLKIITKAWLLYLQFPENSLFSSEISADNLKVNTT